MCGCIYAAIGLFFSSLTESVILAFIMSVVANFFTWFVGMGVDTVDSAMARNFFEHISLSSHVTAMVEGTLRSSSIVFGLSMVLFFCYLTNRVIETIRLR